MICKLCEESFYCPVHDPEMYQECDCSCHPANGLVSTQHRWQFGTMKIGNKEHPCYCCWCHYIEADIEE